MKKYLMLLSFSLFITVVSFGQNNYQDVVYLKNGDTIRGVIIEHVPNKSIKIKTEDKGVLVYQMDEVEKLTKEPIQAEGGISFGELDLKSIYRGIIELGYQIGVGDYGTDRLKLDLINSYQINSYFSLGFGIGLRYYFEEDEALIPFFAYFRSNFMDNKTSPYFSLGMGYSLNASRDFEGDGFILNSTIGISFKISERAVMNVGIGYEMQKMEIDYFYAGSENSGAIGANIGISF